MKSWKTMAACVALLLAFVSVVQAGTPAARPADSVYQLSVPLTDAQGKTRNWRALQGKPRIVAMFYTSCPYMCPLIVESAKGSPFSLKTREYILRFGLAAIALLFIVVMFNDTREGFAKLFGWVFK